MPDRWAPVRLAVPIGVLLAAMLLVPIDDVRPEGDALGYAGTGAVQGVLDLLAGLLLLLAGVVASVAGLPRRVVALALAAGVAWFGPALFALDDAHEAIRALGRFLLSPMVLPLLLHLALASVGMDRGRVARLAIAVAYAVSLVTSVGALVTYDAAMEVHCRACDWRNPFLVHWQAGIIRSWQVAGAVSTTGVSLVAGALAWRALRRATVGSGRSAGRWAVGAGLLGVAAGGMARSFSSIVVRAEHPELVAWQLTWALLALSVMAIAMGVIALAAEAWLRSSRLRTLTASLEAAPPPGTLAVELARLVGDPTLRVSYRLDSGDLVDAMGGPAAPAGSGQVETPIERDGGVLALVVHGPAVAMADLARALGPTVLAALDNERLRAAQLARLAELRASRARIVATSDAERRRLERDLHDGVQQQLLTILFDLRIERLEAERAGDGERAAVLATAESLAQAAVDDLRRIAHGIHPAVLSRAGLGPALASLAEGSPVAVDLAVDGVGRLPEAVEAAAYQVITEQLRDAAAGGATGVAVTAAVDAGHLALTIERDDAALPEVPLRIADRVGAAGGDAHVEALASGGTLLRVELPCA